MADLEQSQTGTPDAAKRGSLKELALFFLRLGVTAFGGPAAHIAIMEDELVRRRKWLSREKFLDLLGASSLIPGPSSSELAIHIGYLRGRLGGVADRRRLLYFSRGNPGGNHCLGVRALRTFACGCGAAVRSQASGDCRDPAGALGTWPHGGQELAPGGCGRDLCCAQFRASECSDHFVRDGRDPCGYARAIAESDGKPKRGTCADVYCPSWRGARTGLRANFSVGGRTGVAAVIPGMWPLFLVFLRIGSIVFGSGYVLLAFLRADLVVHRAWVTDAQLVDAVAIGQVTPGPVFTTATFLGYLLRGPVGALVATVGIFLPAFVLVAISGPLIPLIRRSATAGAFLDGVNVASLALMAAVSYQLGRSAIVDWADVGSGHCQRGAAAALPNQFGVAGAWRGDHRHRRPAGARRSRIFLSRECPVVSA